MKIYSNRIFYVYVNKRCNMRCSYCYDARPRTGEEMADDTVDACLHFFRREAREVEHAELMILGGEPSLSPRVVRRMMAGVPPDWRFQMMTNAWDWSTEFLEILAAYKDRMTIIPSYDGRFQDRRKPGSGPRVRANIERLIREGYRVLPCWTLTADTVGDLFPAAVELADWHPFLFIKRNCSHNVWGNDAAYVDGWRRNIDRFADLLAWNTVARDGFIKTVNHIHRGTRLHWPDRRGTFSCHTEMGWNVVVDVDGKIYPCELFVTDGRHCMGDVFHGFDLDKLREWSEAVYPGAKRCHNVCPYWNEVRNGDFQNVDGCLNDTVDRLLLKKRHKVQKQMDRLWRLKTSVHVMPGKEDSHA